MKKLYLKSLIFAVLTVFLFSCASKQNKQIEISGNGYGYGEQIKEQILTDISQVQASTDYLLQPGDLVEIKVFMENDMDRILRIATNGSITFPLVGSLKISGYSVSKAENIVAEALKEYIKSPQVSMLIKEYGNKTVYVLGQVKKPSAIQIPPEKSLTVLEAITSVGGFTDVANTSKVKVLRMEKAKQKSIDVDITQITKQGKKSLDISLMPGDVVFVPQSIF